MALKPFRPTTRGTVTWGGSPVETWIVTSVPRNVTVPPPGDWLKICPFGLSESPLETETRNPASERIALASLLLHPDDARHRTLGWLGRLGESDRR